MYDGTVLTSTVIHAISSVLFRSSLLVLRFCLQLVNPTFTVQGTLSGALRRSENTSKVEGAEFNCDLMYMGNNQINIIGRADSTRYPQLTLEVRHQKWGEAAPERSRKWSLLAGVQSRGRLPDRTPGATDERAVGTADNTSEVVEFGVFTRKQVGEERSTQRLTPQLLLQVHQRIPAGLAVKLHWRPTAISEMKAFVLFSIAFLESILFICCLFR